MDEIPGQRFLFHFQFLSRTYSEVEIVQVNGSYGIRQETETVQVEIENVQNVAKFDRRI